MSWCIINPDQILAIGEVEHSKWERVAALVICAMLDQSLRASIWCRLRADRDITRKIFTPNGALGDTTRKVDVAYMLNVFEKDVHAALTGITEIRNLFAHNLSIHLDSADTRMALAVKKLRLHQGRTEYPHPFLKRSSNIAMEPVVTTLDQLIVNGKICLIVLNGDFYMQNPGSEEPAFYNSFVRDSHGQLLDRHGRPIGS